MDVHGRRGDDNLYDILGVSCDATSEEMKKKHRANLLRYSPDKVGHGSTEEHEEATEHYLKLQEAWKTLSDPRLKQQYDAQLKARKLEYEVQAGREVGINEMEFDSEGDIYYYPCRCGDEFEVQRSSVPAEVQCATCSISLRVIHEKT